MILPPLLTLDTCGGDWERYLECVHDVYLSQIVRGGLTFRGLRVATRRTPETRGKGYGFWHMIQEGRVEEDRMPDLRRCERLCWVPHVIRAADRADPRVSVWQNVRGGNIHVPLWLEDEDYLVILAQRQGHWLLKTQYIVTYRNRREALRQERDAFLVAQNG
ncbi:hypothetical protein [Teichococcus rhizosphaerae]|uniref:hypothetical protein n=1 Tax=Teichococcus rhizosphaerae TaxID=1335062 RepID=UPI001145DEB2|nr:hypothetical protein [Pseudoroseomonas rhizosphaerae]